MKLPGKVEGPFPPIREVTVFHRGKGQGHGRTAVVTAVFDAGIVLISWRPLGWGGGLVAAVIPTQTTHSRVSVAGRGRARLFLVCPPSFSLQPLSQKPKTESCWEKDGVEPSAMMDRNIMGG